MSSEHSVSHWIASVTTGDVKGVLKLWNRYIDRLWEMAWQRLAGVPKKVADEEDVAQRVFLCLCRGGVAGRFDDVKIRDDLWWLLLAITRQKAVDMMRRETA